MTRSVPDVDRMTRYLLGELSEADQEALEADWFADPDVFQGLLAVEDDLFDAYLAGELTGPQRVRFEQRFLDTPQGRERLEFARSLRRWAAKVPEPRQGPEAAASPREVSRRAYRLALPVAAAAMVAGLAWLSFQGASLRRELARVQTELAAAQASERESQSLAADLRTRIAQFDELLARLRTGSTPSGVTFAAVVSTVLRPGMVRDRQPPQALVLPPDADWAQVDLLLPADEHAAYGVTLETPDGTSLWDRGSLQAQNIPPGRAVRVTFQAGLLAPGHYVLSLRGLSKGGRPESVEDYAFRLVKRR